MASVRPWNASLEPKPMSIVDELRYPRRWYTKLIVVVLTLIFFVALATAAIAGVLTYWIIKPQRTELLYHYGQLPRPARRD